MMSKNKTILFMFLLFSAGNIFPQEEKNFVKDDKPAGNYAINVISKVIKESPEGIILSNNAEAAKLSFKQQEKVWLPTVQLDVSTGIKTMQGDYQYVKNKGILSSPQTIVEPTANIGIYQKLPGNGQFSIDVGYGFSYLTGQNAYIQQPYLQFGYTQNFSDGAFFFKKDPSVEILKNQQKIFILEEKEAKFELATRFITAVQNYNLALLEHEYCEVLLKKTNAEYQEQSYRHKNGQRNDIELFNSHMNKTQAIQSYQQATQKLLEMETILAGYEIEDIMIQSNLFREEILKLLDITYGEKLQKTMQEYEILNQIDNEKWSYKIEEAKMAPSLFIQTSFVPDQNKNSEYSDLSRSLRNLVKTRYAWNISTTIGISVGLDFTSQGKALREISDKKIQNLNLQLELLRDEQNNVRNLYREWTIAFSSYCDDMEKALKEEEKYRKDIKTLMEWNMITEAEYWSTEASYYETRLNYYRSIWNMIQGKINILKLSSDWEEFIQQFLEVME